MDSNQLQEVLMLENVHQHSFLNCPENMKLNLPFFSWKAESQTRYVDLGGMRRAGQEPNFVNQFESENDFLEKNIEYWNLYCSEN